MAFRVLLVATAVVAVCLGQQQYLEADYADYDSGHHQQQARPAPTPRAVPARAFNALPAPKPTPVAILKQINRHNDDGSYTYGFEGADGTFKIETKFANGDVKGKYGFVDDTGKVRTVEYGADRYGFQPAGEGITVAPPTLVDESLTEEDPEELEFRPRPAPRPQQPRAKPAPRPRPQPQQQYQPQPQQYQPEPQYQPQPQQYQPQPAAHQGAFEQQTTFHQYQVQEPQEPPRRAALRTSPVPQRPVAVAGAVPVAPHHSMTAASPVPQRPLAIPGASPVPARTLAIPGAFQAEPPRRQQPAPQRSSSPRAGPAPQQAAHFQPQFQPQQHFQPQPQQFQQQPRAFQAPRAAHGSVLDQLAKDYALPKGAPALHDITFSSY